MADLTGRLACAKSSHAGQEPKALINLWCSKQLDPCFPCSLVDTSPLRTPREQEEAM